MWYESLIDRGLLPESLIRLGIRRQLAARLREETRGGASAVERRRSALLEELAAGPIAVATEAANDQHYEVQPDFYAAVLGPWRKYSCGYWDENASDLAGSELRMLQLYAERARVEDGQRILDLGCGWGSLSLFLAQNFPAVEVTSVSNSASQVATITALAAGRGLPNLRATRCDVKALDFDGGRFDRVLSIEMFEHMQNWGTLLERIAGWLRPGGLAFVHHFAHRELLYRYIAQADGSWMARHFFTGGIMPSADLLSRFDDHMQVVDSWDVDGHHYQRTCEAWLQEMSVNRPAVETALAASCGDDEVTCRWHRWRVFFLACAELFGYDEGRQWIVAHRLLARRADLATQT